MRTCASFIALFALFASIIPGTKSNSTIAATREIRVILRFFVCGKKLIFNRRNIDFLYNNSYEVEGNIIAGTRGWVQSNEEEDKKMINRETIRLELSIKDGIQKYGEDKPIIICMHYPPYTNYNVQNLLDSPFIEIMRKYNVKKCIYGHLHGESIKEAIQGNIKGIDTTLVSADGVNFKLMKIVGDKREEI